MAGQPILQFHPQLAADYSNRDEAKKKVSDVLKRVDQFIRKGDLDLAQGEIFKAKEIDPRNAYTVALEERIHILKSELERIEKSHQSKETPDVNKIPAASEAKPETVQMSPVSKPVAVRPTPMNSAKTIAAPAAQVQNSEVVVSTSQQQPHQGNASDRSIELETYHKALMDAWSDGALSENERRQMDELKTLLEITNSEHERLEKTVKHECYKNAVIQSLSLEPNASNQSKSFLELQRLFQISNEEHQQIQAQILSNMHQKHRDKILVIDDDTRLLELLQTSLEDHGFEVIALSTSDEAYALLRKLTPDLILCDINLETSAMGGFAFYEKIQGFKHIQDVPFVFLTGLTDEALVRTGKELGVDDFLMKPISERMLVSALRGKLKRFKQLKKSAPLSLASAAASN
jgi:CheY-like chemotaxis protein